MTGNKSHLSNYKEIDGGFVSFGGSTKGGKITSKGKIRTDTECVVLSPDFKLLDENQVLLRVPRKNNMYSVDLKNVALSGGLTCLFINATLDESNLWHRRLGHINFKTMNKLVRGNLVRGRKYALSFMRPFGCHVTILNTLDNLGKFDGKADEGFFVGYSVNSKAFIVFNSRTMIVEENLHITFLENKPTVIGSGPEWLFDIDTLTKSINYKPVVSGNKTNGNAGTKESIDAGQAEKKIIPSQKSIILQPFICADDPNMPNLEEIVYSEDDEGVGAEADMNNFDTFMLASPIPTTRIHKDHPFK
ncbi:ribonuclease H-like domain-containing protein [Tanacetum coccineum]